MSPQSAINLTFVCLALAVALPACGGDDPAAEGTGGHGGGTAGDVGTVGAGGTAGTTGAGGAARGGTGGGSCNPGILGCQCWPDATCNGDFQCVSNVCSAGSARGGTIGSAGHGGATGAGGTSGGAAGAGASVPLCADVWPGYKKNSGAPDYTPTYTPCGALGSDGWHYTHKGKTICMQCFGAGTGAQPRDCLVDSGMYVCEDAGRTASTPADCQSACVTSCSDCT